MVVELPEPRAPLRVAVERHAADVGSHPADPGRVQFVGHPGQLLDPRANLRRSEALNALAMAVGLVLAAQGANRSPAVVEGHVLAQVQQGRRRRGHSRHVLGVPHMLRAVVQDVREGQRRAPFVTGGPFVRPGQCGRTGRPPGGQGRRTAFQAVPRRRGIRIVAPPGGKQPRPFRSGRQEGRQMPPQLETHVVRVDALGLGLQQGHGPRRSALARLERDLHLGPFVEVPLLAADHRPRRVAHLVAQPLPAHAGREPQIEVPRARRHEEVERPPLPHGLQRLVQPRPIGVGETRRRRDPTEVPARVDLERQALLPARHDNRPLRAAGNLRARQNVALPHQPRRKTVLVGPIAMRDALQTHRRRSRRLQGHVVQVAQLRHHGVRPRRCQTPDRQGQHCTMWFHCPILEMNKPTSSVRPQPTDSTCVGQRGTLRRSHPCGIVP